MDDLVAWLENWYARQSGETGESAYGITIRTLDNSGWWVKIVLRDTALQERSFQRTERVNGDDDWVECWLEHGVFEGVGGFHNLGTILELFRDWADGGEQPR